jgi:mannitol/fructose-specific phosphotransferase system IIA component (Ntr-type)
MTKTIPGGSPTLARTGVRLADFLAPQAVHLEMAATTKDEALEELLSLIPLKDVDRRITLETLRQREAIGSTGVGMGVAIPHCRSSTFSKLLVAFGRSSKGVAYQSVDKKKVRLFFLVVSPPVELTNFYHPVLAAIVNLTKEEHNRKRLLDAESAAEVKTILTEAVS